MPDQPPPPATPDPAARRRNRIKLLAILAVCASPVIASYLAYYFLKPEGRTNYGELVQPQVPVAGLAVSELPGMRSSAPAPAPAALSTAASATAAPATEASATASSGTSGESSLGRFRGRWIMLTTTTDGRCADDCAQRLYVMRQVRLTTGKDRDRIERVLLLSADAPVPTLPEGHEGLQVLRTDAAALASLRAASAPDQTPGILLIDPLGNLMMRFPANPDASRMKKDLAKLLRASRVG
jgi:hypothetical protein